MRHRSLLRQRAEFTLQMGRLLLESVIHLFEKTDTLYKLLTFAFRSVDLCLEINEIPIPIIDTLPEAGLEYVVWVSVITYLR